MLSLYRRAVPLALVLAGLTAVGVHSQTPTLTSQDVGIPLLFGNTTTAGGKITITGGGNDIWGNSDNFHYAYFNVTGNFDYVVRVEDLQGPDNWSKAELMARVTDPAFGPEGGDPHLSNMTTRSGGQNQLGPQWRGTRGGASGWISPAGTPRPTYPNTWLRMERIGSVFYLYYSSDGSNWTLYDPVGRIDTTGVNPPAGAANFFTEAWPNTIALGLAVTAHNDGDLNGATAVFSNFAPHVTVPIAITTQPAATVTVSENQPLVLSVQATGDPVHYQWRKGGTDIQGAMQSTFRVDLAKQADSGTYTVRLFGAGNEVISSQSVVTVTQDTEPPTIVKAAPDETFRAVVVEYSEPVGASAEVAANYSLGGGATVSSVSRVDPFKVSLTTSRLAEGTDYVLTINNVQDTASPANTIATGSTAEFKSFIFQVGAVLHKFWASNTANNLAALTNNARFPNAPTMVTIEPRWEYGPNGSGESGSDYGNQLVGWFLPPQTGNYIFFTNSDDPSNLYLSTNDDPANKKLIAQENGWSGVRNWVSVGGGASTIDNKRSDFFADSEWPTFAGFFAIPLQAGQRYYMESIHTEGGGGDSVAATFIMESEPDPVNGDAPRITGDAVGTYLDPNGASVTIDQAPQNVTVDENRTATLVVEATGTSAYGSTVTYQWQQAAAGSSTFTDVSGATADTYTTPLLTAADNGIQFRVIARVPTVEVISDAATITVSSDTTPPTIISAGALSGDNQVGVAFSELLDQASAERAANYQISGATVTSATLHNGRIVQLDLSGAVSAPFTLTVNGVADAAGNAMASATVDGQITSDLTAADIGIFGTDPIVDGDAFSYGNGGYFVSGGGNDIWDVDDAFHYLYKEFTGPFDMRARVDSLVGGDEWGKATLMARESLEPGSRNQAALITKPAPYEGNAFAAANKSVGGVNVYNHQWRDTADAASGSKAGGERISPTVFPSWIRLIRADASSNEMKSFISYDGQNWIDYHTHGTPGDPLPATLFVGMGVTSHDNGATHPRAEVIYDSFSVRTYQDIVDPNLAISMSGNDVVISWAAGTLISSGTVTGPYSPVAGATSPHQVAPSGTAMFFQVQQ